MRNVLLSASGVVGTDLETHDDPHGVRVLVRAHSEVWKALIDGQGRNFSLAIADGEQFHAFTLESWTICGTTGQPESHRLVAVFADVRANFDRYVRRCLDLDALQRQRDAA